jgi:hypothetical protein
MIPAKQLVVTSVLVFLMSSHAAAQEGFKLVIRGGENVGLKLVGVDQHVVHLIVDFKFGDRPVGAGLSPGQGSWMDRGMRPGEPTRLIYFRINRAKAEKIAASLRNPRVQWAFWCNNTGEGHMKVTRDVQVTGPPPVIID